jgi:malate dehydrogenase (oxaloacetate-decarboxylating)(NADP+)
MEIVPAAVAQAAMDSGVAQRRIENMDEYRTALRARLNPTTSVLTLAYEAARANPKRVLFAEGEEDVVLRAAIAFRDGGYGIPVLVGREDVYDRLKALGVDDPHSFEVYNSRNYPGVPELAERLYNRLQRRGYLQREIERTVNQDRNTFAALLLEAGEADVMITGVTRTFAQNLRQILRVLDPKPGVTPFGIHIMVGQSYTVFIADTTVTERPSAEQLVEIAIQTAGVARRMGQEPRVAFLSYSFFGNPEGTYLERIRDAVKLMDQRDDVDFEYEGEMPPDVALNPQLHRVYPFSRLTGPANVLVMPGLQTANISAKLLRELGGDAVIGPVLVGMKQQIQVAPMTATASDLVTLAVLGAGGIVR